MDGQLWVLEIDAPPLRLLDQAADFALDLRRREGNPLVGAACADTEARRLAIAEVGQDRVGQLPEVVRRSGRRARSSRCRRRGAIAIAGRVASRRPDPRSISMRPITERTPVTSSPFSAGRRLRTSTWTNHGRLRPFSASSL